jgi:flagellar basal-body rod protein FlgB
MNTIDKALGISAQALGMRSRRMEVLSQNIANADTPNFKARDIKFGHVLQSVADNGLRATASSHFSVAEESPAPGVMYRVPFNNSFDGNTVELNIEQAQYGQAAAEYQATLNILENRVNGLKRALRGD